MGAGRQVAFDPGVGDLAGVCFRQAPVVADRPGERHDQQQERHGREPAEAAGEGGERRHERQDVPVPVRVERAEVEEVDDHERREDQVVPAAAGDGDGQPEAADQQRGAKRLPQAVEVRDRGRVVVLEAEPALPGHLLNAVGVAERGPEVRDEVRVRQREGDPRADEPQRETARLPPPGDAERDDQEYPGVLEARREPDGNTAQLDPAGHEEGERGGHAEHQRHVADWALTPG